MANAIVIAGSLAQRPGVGGHTWVFLQYILGFRRLGWDVLFLDDLRPEMCKDRSGQPCEPNESWNVQYVRDVFRRFGLEEHYAIFCDGRSIAGCDKARVVETIRGAAFLLNVMGYLTDLDLLSAARLRVFLDIDPGFGQMWKALGLADIFLGHDRYLTIGENIGLPGCTIPIRGINWLTTRPPIVLEHWPAIALPDVKRAPFTSVASWRGAFGPIEYEGRTYGLRVHEFRKFFELPRLTGRPFELALNIASAEKTDLTALRSNDWRLVDPQEVAGDTQTYQSYIQNSAAEFMVAKNMYVQTRGGWFSDRSACYLASGRPVLAQDTGLAGLYPTGEGLLTFSSLDEAAACVREIDSNYPRHARAARALAEEHFDSDRVLRRLLNKLGVG